MQQTSMYLGIVSNKEEVDIFYYPVEDIWNTLCTKKHQLNCKVAQVVFIPHIGKKSIEAALTKKLMTQRWL